MPRLLLFLFSLLTLSPIHSRALPATATEAPTLQRDSTALGIPFTRYTTRDHLGRTITFYVSLTTPPPATATSQPRPLPLCVFIGGSGGQSVWMRRGDRIAGGYQNVLLQVLAGRGIVLVVEKPGVPFCFQPPHPGAAEGCPEEFLREHTLPRWAEAVGAAVRAARTLPGVDQDRTLLIGHSEGGIVAAVVAANDPKITHVASLAGGGPTQLFDRMISADSRANSGSGATTAPGGAEIVREQWAKIQADPDSVTKFAWGHPYRRWSSFCATSTIDQMLKSRARLYLAQGSEDHSVPPITMQIALAELLTRGREVTAELVSSGDHGFRKQSDAPGDPAGMRAVFTHVVDWFLADVAAAAR